MTQPPSPRRPRPSIGVMVDPQRMAAARKSAMLERIELACLSQALDLIKVATENGIDVGTDVNLDQITEDMLLLRKLLADSGISLRRPGLHIGVSRDEIAKLETDGRKRPKITTLRKLIGALNYARAGRGKPPLDIEDLQIPGEVLIPEAREKNPEEDLPDWERQILERQALGAYQEASNDIYYAEQDERDDPWGAAAEWRKDQ